MSQATIVLNALAERLASIAPVRMGLAAGETTSATLPVITIWSLSEALAANQDYDAPMYTRRAALELKIVATEQFHVTLDDLLLAIRELLTADLRISSTTFLPPADNGDSAILQVTFEFDY
ncbi:hypothetical protein [Chromatium okenii]|jgi:hypothetical protein|uniref:hypothetical protein n=1 Tax=Chromatium okenii TaxID=61644 RepID=UPI0026E93568|nr:hypothetical protein [Chromatium okenii]MBV5311540.1 hypothetical protein [Chromatium okenii]